jgi:hypothetical protein
MNVVHNERPRIKDSFLFANNLLMSALLFDAGFSCYQQPGVGLQPTTLTQPKGYTATLWR